MANEMHYGQRKCTVDNETAVDIVMLSNSSAANRSQDETGREEFCNANANLCVKIVFFYRVSYHV